jgi:hypothetical protein
MPLDFIRAINSRRRFRSILRVFVALAAAVGGLGFLFALCLHLYTFFNANLRMNAMFVAGHVGAIALGALTRGLYGFRDEPLDSGSYPRWARKPLMFLVGYFVLNIVLLAVARDENPYSQTIMLRFFTSGWLFFYAALFAQLTGLWDNLRPGFREIRWSRDD